MFIQCFGDLMLFLIMGILTDYKITLIFISVLIFIILCKKQFKNRKNKLNNSSDLIIDLLTNLFTFKYFNAKNSCYNNFVKCVQIIKIIML